MTDGIMHPIIHEKKRGLKEKIEMKFISTILLLKSECLTSLALYVYQTIRATAWSLYFINLPRYYAISVLL